MKVCHIESHADEKSGKQTSVIWQGSDTQALMVELWEDHDRFILTQGENFIYIDINAFPEIVAEIKRIIK